MSPLPWGFFFGAGYWRAGSVEDAGVGVETFSGNDDEGSNIEDVEMVGA